MNETALMLKVKDGELEYMRKLFELYNKQLYNFYLRLTHDKMLSEDLTQNVFLRALKYKHTFNENQTFRPWIFQIARNVLYDQQKKTASSAPYDLELKDTEQNTEERLIANEQHQALWVAMEKLSIQERELIELHRFQKMKYEDIAQMTGSTQAAVKMKANRILKKLKKMLSNQANV